MNAGHGRKNWRGPAEQMQARLTSPRPAPPHSVRAARQKIVKSPTQQLRDFFPPTARSRTELLQDRAYVGKRARQTGKGKVI